MASAPSQIGPPYTIEESQRHLQGPIDNAREEWQAHFPRQHLDLEASRGSEGNLPPQDAADALQDQADVKQPTPPESPIPSWAPAARLQSAHTTTEYTPTSKVLAPCRLHGRPGILYVPVQHGCIAPSCRDTSQVNSSDAIRMSQCSVNGELGCLHSAELKLFAKGAASCAGRQTCHPDVDVAVPARKKSRTCYPLWCCRLGSCSSACRCWRPESLRTGESRTGRGWYLSRSEPRTFCDQ